jgi:hypothetical protein
MDSRTRLNAPAGALLALLCMPAPSWAAFVYDETIDGDLSGDGLNPTVLIADFGKNVLSGTTVAGDLDYLTFNVAAGFTLEMVILADYESLDNLSFMAVQSGSTFTEPPVGTDPANLLGWVHFGGALEGSDILDDMGAGDGAIGFTPPLPAGDYSFWIQQTGIDKAGYEMHFVIAPVPVPAALYLLGSGVLALGGYARVRRRSATV